MSKAIVVAALLLSSSAAAFAQDLGEEWINRVTRELRSERDTVNAPMTNYGASAGLVVFHDDNIFLTEKNEKDDTIWVPFAELRIDYDDPNVELGAALMVDHKYYVEEEDQRDTEIRFLGKAGYTGTRFSASLIQLLRKESDPLDAIFFERTERFVSDTLPRITFDVTETFGLELGGQIQIVRFEEDVLADSRDNTNYTVDLSFVYKTDFNIDFLINGGLMAIDYAEDGTTAPPDVDGFFVRGGLRGELSPDIRLQALVGWAKAESDDFPAGSGKNPEEHSTGTASLFVSYQASELWVLSAGYSREFAFAGGQDPFQVVNRIGADAEFKALPELTLNGRIDFTRVDSSLGVERDYFSLGAQAAYRVMEHVVVDGGFTFRSGQVTGAVVQKVDYDNFIVSLGAAVTY